MPEIPVIGPVHHLALTVADLERSKSFDAGVLGLRIGMTEEDSTFLTNGAVGLELRQAPDAADRAVDGRVGLTRVSFALGNLDDLERAARYLDGHGVPRGEVVDLGRGMGRSVLTFRDPDNIQLEPTATHE